MHWFKFFFVFALLLCLMKLPCFVEALSPPSSKRGLSHRRFVGFWIVIVIIYTSSKNLFKFVTQGVVSHSSEPEARHKSARRKKLKPFLTDVSKSSVYLAIYFLATWLSSLSLLINLFFACSTNDATIDWQKVYAWFVLKAKDSAWHVRLQHY